MNNIRKAGIVIKPHAPSVEGILKIVVEYFEGRGIACVLEDVPRGAGSSAGRTAWSGQGSPPPGISPSSSAETGRPSAPPTTPSKPASSSWGASTWAAWGS